LTLTDSHYSNSNSNSNDNDSNNEQSLDVPAMDAARNVCVNISAVDMMIDCYSSFQSMTQQPNNNAVNAMTQKKKEGSLALVQTVFLSSCCVVVCGCGCALVAQKDLLTLKQ